jgi:hypothetical protein
MTILKYGNTQIVLRSPDFSDQHVLDMGVKIKRSMDNTPYTYKRTPVLATKNFTFSNLDRDKIEEMIVFVKGAAGREIEMIDTDNYIWRGRILNTPMSFTEMARINRTFNLDFQGHIYGKADDITI